MKNIVNSIKKSYEDAVRIILLKILMHDYAIDTSNYISSHAARGLQFIVQHGLCNYIYRKYRYEKNDKKIIIAFKDPYDTYLKAMIKKYHEKFPNEYSKKFPNGSPYVYYTFEYFPSYNRPYGIPPSSIEYKNRCREIRLHFLEFVIQDCEMSLNMTGKICLFILKNFFSYKSISNKYYLI